MVVNKKKKISNKVCLNLGYSCSLALVLGFLQHCVIVVQTVRLSLYCTGVELPISTRPQTDVYHLTVDRLARWVFTDFLRDARTQEKNKMAHI